MDYFNNAVFYLLIFLLSQGIIEIDIYSVSVVTGGQVHVISNMSSEA